MTTTQHQESPTILDPGEVESYIGLAAEHATCAINALLVGLGDRLGLWKALANAGPVTVDELSDRAEVNPRYLQEWLSAMTASSFLRYDPTARTFELPAAGAAVLADDDSPNLFIAPFEFLPLIGEMLPALATGFRSGVGIGWLEHADELHDAEARLTRPLHRAMLIDVWLAAVPGLLDRLASGARVADVGCGQGQSTIELATRFPRSAFVGFDFHDHSIARAREAAMAAGVADRAIFEVADARALPGDGFDVVLLCDALHDMGDPVAVASQAHDALVPGGQLVTLDPRAAGDSLEENLEDPFAAMFYAVSCFICIPSAISQDGPEVLGALAGESAIRRVLTDAGFSSVERHGHDAPINMVIAGRKAEVP